MARRGIPANNMPDLRLTFICAVLTLILTGHPGPSSVYALRPPLLPPGGEVRNGEVFHSILKGQSLYLLAGDYLPLTDFYTPAGLVEELMRINGLKGTLLHIGKELKVPVIRFSPMRAKTVPRKSSFVAKGIYITGIGAGTKRILRLGSELRKLGGNTIVFDAKDMSGIVFYHSKVSLVKEIGANNRVPIRDLGKMICQLHDMGIHVVARIVLFHDRLLAEKRQDLSVRSRSTGKLWGTKGGVGWVDPSLKEVQRYNLDLARELAASGVDEIQFDYIRFPATGNTDDAMYSFDEAKTPKHKVITGFLKRAYRELNPLGVLVSIDVYGIIAWEKEMDINITGQKIDDLARYTDIISPMLYPSHFSRHFGKKPIPADDPYYVVYNGCIEIVETTRRYGAIIRPWLQAFPLGVTHFREDYILEQIKAAKAASTTGWLLWDAENTYKVALKALDKLGSIPQD